jgi:hypothetical protein
MYKKKKKMPVLTNNYNYHNLLGTANREIIEQKVMFQEIAQSVGTILNKIEVISSNSPPHLQTLKKKKVKKKRIIF